MFFLIPRHDLCDIQLKLHSGSVIDIRLQALVCKDCPCVESVLLDLNDVELNGGEAIA